MIKIDLSLNFQERKNVKKNVKTSKKTSKRQKKREKIDLGQIFDVSLICVYYKLV